MSRTFHHGERRILVRGIRKDQPELRRLARALIELAQAEAERDAEIAHQRMARRQAKDNKPPEVGNSTTEGDAA
jgi:hypothetical protein